MLKTDPITVLHISPSYKPAFGYGGPTRSIAKLCESLTDACHQIKTVVLTTTANGDKELKYESGIGQRIEGVEVYFFQRWTKDHTHFAPGLLVALHRYLKKANKEKRLLVIHIHSWWNLVAVLSAALSIYHRFPCIISPRGMLTAYTLSFRNTFSKYLIHGLIGRYLLQKAHLHATTRLEGKDLKQHLRTSKISIIPNLITLDNRIEHDSFPFNSDLPSNKECLKLLFLSRIDPKKGLELLFDALAVLPFCWTLTIAGTGKPAYIRLLKQLAGSLKISKHIRWIGQIEDAEKRKLLTTHDLLVLVSRNENFGNVVLESLLVGTAVLISDQVGLAAYVEEVNLGWICKTQRSDIASKLEDIYLNRAKRSQIRINGPQQISRDFNTRKILQEYINLYQMVLSNSTSIGIPQSDQATS